MRFELLLNRARILCYHYTIVPIAFKKFLAGLPSLLASYGRVITLLTKNFAHGAGFEPAMGLLRQINSLDRSANYGNPYFCGSGRIRTYSAEATDLQSVPPLQLRRTPIRPYYTIL